MPQGIALGLTVFANLYAHSASIRLTTGRLSQIESMGFAMGQPFFVEQNSTQAPTPAPTTAPTTYNQSADPLASTVGEYWKGRKNVNYDDEDRVGCFFTAEFLGHLMMPASLLQSGGWQAFFCELEKGVQLDWRVARLWLRRTKKNRAKRIVHKAESLYEQLGRLWYSLAQGPSFLLKPMLKLAELRDGLKQESTGKLPPIDLFRELSQERLGKANSSEILRLQDDHFSISELPPTNASYILPSTVDDVVKVMGLSPDAFPVFFRKPRPLCAYCGKVLPDIARELLQGMLRRRQDNDPLPQEDASSL
eukprot:gnl/TRDRNA2_/TRDRNA2_177974_c0_seq14.p1 gnl/TRDRNA2_/TRDRNA2_177974_c0~~gnl/TRDRNA2_/TRDRNA2_177974_c0_seq14.p1  ORF type:complete len:307 (+),score=28.81 gnl/TRDRNA2_/TRDRNA2_177974_c0_seq14:64-984(+)